ncbi:MAG TPA: GAF domain-containing SpoIIE family protein phosphatase [Candidatus Aquilonibacter sp.]|nr:GAF domain-containing SpoIIE family protein phosphatase [Candidatus Aquilonibacter sp.]
MNDRNPVPGRVQNEREYLRFLVHAGELLGSSLDYRETMINVCAAAVETVADLCFLVMPAGAERLEIIASASRDPQLLPEVATAGKYLRSSPGRPIAAVADVIEHGTVLYVADVTDGYIEEHATSAEHARFMRDLGYASIIVVPIRAPAEGVLGALALVRTTESGERFDPDALLFAQDLARRCGGAIVRSRAYAENQRIAERFQRAALPRSLPALANVRFDAYYEPAESSMLVGGDWYDAFVLPDGRIGITMGDVTGHGLDAAAFMGSVRNTLRTTLCAGMPLDEALRVADYIVGLQFGQGEYATANVSRLDPQTGVLEMISAGHPGPLIHIAGDGVNDAFLARGLPLGLRSLGPDDQPVEELRLRDGSFIVYFTDGLIEWQRDELAGYEQVKSAMLDPDVRAAEHPAIAIRNTVVTGTHADDIAIMCLCFGRP